MRPLNFAVRQPVPYALRTCTAVLLILSTAPAFAGGPTADELYERFKVARLALADKGPSGALRFYSRSWLEHGVSDAFDAARRPSASTDYVSDTLWTRFTNIGIVSAVFGYRLVTDPSGAPALEMKVTTNLCGTPGGDKPRLDTYSFVHEDGGWRVFHAAFSATSRDLQWYRADKSPIDRFTHFEVPDRTDVWNETFARLGSTERVTSPCGKGDAK
jgi:hypothetical protein